MKDLPLVLIHGYPFDRTMWYSAIASMGSGAKVIAPDLPGFGKAHLDARQEPSMEYYARFLADLLKQGRHEQAVIAGMSMGGYVALAFAEMFPEKVCAIGLISSQAAADSAETKKTRMETIERMKREGVSVVSSGIVPKMFAENRLSNPDLVQYPQLGAERAGVEGLTFALKAMAARPDRTKVLQKLTCPVLILHGSEDKIVPVTKAREMAGICRRPLYVEARGAGHATPLETPDQVANGLIRLIKVCREDIEANSEVAERR